MRAPVQNPPSESVDAPLRLDLDRRLWVQFRGSVVTIERRALSRTRRCPASARWRATCSPIAAPARAVTMRCCFGNWGSGGLPDMRMSTMPNACAMIRRFSRAEAWTPYACSLQHRELMAQDNKFQQEVKALAEPRP